jgi:hypothetical protein
MAMPAPDALDYSVDSRKSPTPRVVFVWTRELDGQRMAGRLRVAHAIRAALSTHAQVKSIRLPSVVTDRTLGRAIGAAASLVLSVLRGQPLPMQCAIFGSPRDVQAVVQAIPPDVETIYLDGVRCFELLRELRRSRPDGRIVVDFDDLMSRRMGLLLAAGQPLSPGYMTERLPRMLRGVATSKTVGRAAALYESLTLKATERRTLALADAVVLLSTKDAEGLEAVRGKWPPSRARVETVAPAVAVVDADPVTPPLRFVFVGTDVLTQNRLTIDYLLDLWRRERVAAPLAMFGHQTRKVSLPASVTMHGYVSNLEEIHDGHSVLLTPSFLRGGIKTKVLEAFSLGTPVIGNSHTFESMPIADYPLRIDDEMKLLAILRDPDGCQQQFHSAVAHGRAYLRSHHAPEVFARRWRQLMGASER